MRWLVLASPLDQHNGYITVCRSLIEALSRQGAELDVFTGGMSWFPSRTGLKSGRIPSRRRIWRLLLAFDDFVLRLFARGRYDGVLVLVEAYAAAGWMFARRRGIPCLVTAHGTYAVRLPRDIPFFRKALQGCARVLPVSRYTRGRMEQEGLRCTFRVVLPGVDKSRFRVCDLPREPVVLFVGNLKSRKGLRFLLDGLALALKRAPKVRLRIVGRIERDSAGYREVTTYIEQEGLPVEFQGAVSDAELAEMYGKVRLNALPSKSEPYYFEGFGLIHLEANACGTLTLGTLSSGNEDAITPGNGYLVEYGDVGALANAIVDAISTDPYPVLNVGELRTWDDMASEYLEEMRASSAQTR